MTVHDAGLRAWLGAARSTLDERQYRVLARAYGRILVEYAPLDPDSPDAAWRWALVEAALSGALRVISAEDDPVQLGTEADLAQARFFGARVGWMVVGETREGDSEQ